MNYRLLLSEMIIDYRERMSLEANSQKRKVYRDIIRDLNLILDIEVQEIIAMNMVESIINK